MDKETIKKLKQERNELADSVKALRGTLEELKQNLESKGAELSEKVSRGIALDTLIAEYASRDKQLISQTRYLSDEVNRITEYWHKL